jgi:hypothetical protein
MARQAMRLLNDAQFGDLIADLVERGDDLARLGKIEIFGAVRCASL